MMSATNMLLKQSLAFHKRTYFGCLNRLTPFLRSTFSTDIVILMLEIYGYAGLVFSQITINFHKFTPKRSHRMTECVIFFPKDYITLL